MEKEIRSKELEQYVEFLNILNPIGHRNLTLVPLGGEASKEVDYLLVSDAIRDGLLKVEETSKSGSVNELMVTSMADKMILMLDGEELVGAKQNRILNTTILLAAKSKTTIPVSCVEQGRWFHKSPAFASGSYSPPYMRAEKSRSVARNLRRVGCAMSDQQEVWGVVADQLSSLNVASPTMALNDIIEHRQDSIDAYVDALDYPAGGARGLISAINGKFVALDMFDKASTLKEVWRRLITGYAMDALVKGGESSKLFGVESAKTLLKHIPDSTLSKFSGVCLGNDWRFESEEILGQALIFEDSCVHMSVFPSRRGRVRHRRIMPPSYRSRRDRNTPPYIE